MKILFLQKRVLFPTDTGGKIRTLNVLRFLAKWHDVTYLCNVGPNEEQYVEQMRELGVAIETLPWLEAPRGSLTFYAQLALNFLSAYPFNVAKDYDRKLRQRAEQLLSQHKFDLVICDFVQMARNAIGLPGPAKLLFQHNVEAEIFKRHAMTGNNLPLRWLMSHQWRKMRRFEADAGRRFDAVVAVSERDQNIFQEQYGWNHVQTIDTAVDVEFFQPGVAAEQQDHIVFVGSMDWLPNEDGVEYFVRDVWPIVRAARPHAKFQIVGRSPSAKVKVLATTAGVEVVGTVPDVRPFLANASAVVVPLRIGGGTRIKIFEAMAMGKAIVSTSLGAEGLAVTSSENIELADTPGEMADKLIRLLQDADYRGQMGQNARRLVVDNFGAETVARQFERICCETAKATSATAQQANIVTTVVN